MGRFGKIEEFRDLVLAEIGGFEQLLDQDDLRSLRCCLAHELLGPGDVGGQIPGAGHLGGGDGDGAGHLYSP